MIKNSRLKIVMFEKNITQENLSQKTGIPRAYISLAVNGRFNLDRPQKRKIAKALGMLDRDVFPENQIVEGGLKR